MKTSCDNHVTWNATIEYSPRSSALKLRYALSMLTSGSEVIPTRRKGREMLRDGMEKRQDDSVTSRATGRNSNTIYTSMAGDMGKSHRHKCSAVCCVCVWCVCGACVCVCVCGVCVYGTYDVCVVTVRQ